MDFNEKDKSMKENLSMSDALILIYHELKRFNDRVNAKKYRKSKGRLTGRVGNILGERLGLLLGGKKDFIIESRCFLLIVFFVLS